MLFILDERFIVNLMVKSTDDLGRWANRHVLIREQKLLIFKFVSLVEVNSFHAPVGVVFFQ